MDDEQLGVRARDEPLEVRALDEQLVQRAQPEIPYALEHIEPPPLQTELVPAPVPEVCFLFNFTCSHLYHGRTPTIPTPVIANYRDDF